MLFGLVSWAMPMGISAPLSFADDGLSIPTAPVFVPTDQRLLVCWQSTDYSLNPPKSRLNAASVSGMTPKLFPLTVLVPETWTDWRGMSWLPISPQNGVVFHPTDDPVPADILVRRYRGDLWVLSRKGERLILTVTPLDEMTPFTAFSAFRTFNQNASATTPVTVCADSEYFYNVATDSGSALLLHIAHRTLGQWTRYSGPQNLYNRKGVA
jgi:hypothetical protein